MGTMGLHVQQHYWLCCDASNVHDMKVNCIHNFEIKRAIDKSKPVKETCVNIPAVPLEF